MRLYEVDPVKRHENGYFNPSQLVRPTFYIATTFNHHYDKTYDANSNSVSAWQEYVYRTYLNEANYLWTQLAVCEPMGMLTNEQNEDIAVGGSMYFPTSLIPNFENIVWFFNKNSALSGQLVKTSFSSLAIFMPNDFQ